MSAFAHWPAPVPGAADGAEVMQHLAALALGRRDALAALYRREAGPVYRYLLAMAGNESAAADATQEAFVALAERPRAFDPARGRLGAYLAGIGRHALLAQRRGTAAWQPLDDAALAELPAEGASPEALLVRRQDLQQVHRAIAALPFVFREALVLVDLQQRGYAEAAAISGCEINTLRTRLHRARQRLAALLDAAPGARP